MDLEKAIAYTKLIVAILILIFMAVTGVCVLLDVIFSIAFGEYLFQAKPMIVVCSLWLFLGVVALMLRG